MEIIWENSSLYLVREQHNNPWVKIFLKNEQKELTDATPKEQMEIFKIALIVEKTMRTFYNPTKINHASFGNVLPKVHWHIQARFADDEFFPEPTWGKKQREFSLILPDFSEFCKLLVVELNASQKDN